MWRSVTARGRRVGWTSAPHGDDLNAAANAIQTIVAVKSDDDWRIAQLQNTPAAFHGRPDEAAVLTEELRAVLRDANTR